MIQFASDHPWATVCLVLILAQTVQFLAAVLFRIFNRRLRAKNIALHGWPTPPLDADGDVVQPKVEP